MSDDLRSKYSEVAGKRMAQRIDDIFNGLGPPDPKSYVFDWHIDIWRYCITLKLRGWRLAK